MSFDTISEVYLWLDNIPKFQTEGAKAANFNLENFEQFCSAIGSPHKQGNFIHVAGTNGKGSTCRLLASVYQNAGYKIGLYTSPHLVDFKERFVVNGRQISEPELLRFFQDNEQALENYSLTYFEISTAIAFWWFVCQKVDLAVIEVGLGGRLDATNIINPTASIITSIALDHTNILGDSIAKITAEKAGIIKPDTPVVVGNVSEEAEAVIKEYAVNKNTEVFHSSDLKPLFDSGSYQITFGDQKIHFDPDFFAPVQAHNIAMAWQTIIVLNDQFYVPQKKIIEGINKSTKNYPNHGRFEKISTTNDWYFDGGHNVEAIRVMKAMAETIKPVSDTILVLSIMEDKLTTEVAKEFSEFKKIFYHTSKLNRAAPVDAISQYLPDLYAMPVNKKLQQKLFEEFESELVIFAGSFYFYPTVKEWMTSFATNR